MNGHVQDSEDEFLLSGTIDNDGMGPLFIDAPAHSENTYTKWVLPVVHFTASQINYLLQSIATLQFWFRLLLVFAFISLTFIFSVISYWSFYWWYIPKIYHELPIDLQFDNVNYVDLPFARIPFTLQCHCSQRLLAPDQLYDLSLTLTVPESLVNEEIGNFMIRTRLDNCLNVTACYSSKPFLFPFRSPLYKLMAFFKRIIPFFFNFSQESYQVDIPLISNLFDDRNFPIQSAHIEISSYRIQIYEAALKIDAQFHGLRYCMYYWFLTTATLCITMIFILVVSFWLFVFILWKFLSRQRESRRNQNGSTSHQASPIPDADSEVELDLQELEEEKEMRHEDDDGASLARMMHEHEQLLLNEDGDTKLTDPKDFLTTEPTVDHHDMDDEQFVPEPAL